jgi:Ca2+-binding EF-hand superfamily protein
MALMSSARLKNLGETWTDEGLNLTEFVQTMTNHIKTTSDDEKYELVYGCFKLFTQVDINGDGMMEWGEFMQYIIDAVQGNTISGDEDQVESVQDQIARIKAKRYHRFQFAVAPIDKTNH